MIFDDYAHHPSEVKVTLEAAAEKRNRRIITVFQPHRYSRLANLKNKFNRCFNLSDLLIITDVYSSGEQPIPGITGKILVDNIIDSGFKNKIVYTLRMKKRKYLGKTEIRSGSFINFEKIGKGRVSYVRVNNNSIELLPYVKQSGFKNVEDWLEKTKGCKYLYKVEVI